MSPSHTTCTVLFVDISGSTRLYETLGDERALARVGGTLAMLTQVCADCGGRVIKTAGDGAMCMFQTADAALRAARLMQEKITERAVAGEKGYGIHIGCHFGPVLENAGDLFGDTVNLAARVAGLAKVGQIITTADTVERLPPVLAERARRLDSVPVKGKRKAVTIFEFLWQDSDDLTAMGTRVERRRDKFVLVDQSSNGTWVQFAGEAEMVVLRREELMLRASGLIGLGHSPTDGQGVPVKFACD